MVALDGSPSPTSVAAAAAAAAALTADAVGGCGRAPPALRVRRPRAAASPRLGPAAPSTAVPSAVAATTAAASPVATAAATTPATTPATTAAPATTDDVEVEEPAADAHLPPAAFYLAYIVPLSVLVGYYLRPPVVGPYLTVALIYVFIPLADAAVGTAHLFGRWSPTPATGGAEAPAAAPVPGNAAAGGGVASTALPLALARARRVPSPTDALAYRLPVYGWLPTQAALLLWAAREAAVGHAAIHTPTFVGLALSVGIVAAGGINAAHELLHRRSRVERAAAVALLASVAYAHFVVEHAIGHHRRVATRADPASAALGVSFYAFLPRTVSGGMRSAWALEAARLRRRGLPAAAHRVGWWAAATVVGVAGLGAMWGWRSVALWAAHAVVAVVILEKVNYMEHYGLVRRRLLRGRLASGDAGVDADADADAEAEADDADWVYEQVGPHHSWEAPQTLTNVLLFKLQRHADHHQHAGRRYQSLRASPSSPVLPAGYPTMALLVMVPPLWAALMDGRARRAVASAPPLEGEGGAKGWA
ncbi:hypothetical protein MMPV_006138 [Pyropia vietnamensis]